MLRTVNNDKKLTFSKTQALKYCWKYYEGTRRAVYKLSETHTHTLYNRLLPGKPGIADYALDSPPFIARLCVLLGLTPNSSFVTQSHQVFLGQYTITTVTFPETLWNAEKETFNSIYIHTVADPGFLEGVGVASGRTPRGSGAILKFSSWNCAFYCILSNNPILMQISCL